uniref:G domain-containing protein n=1 Tax=Rhabditophanes sp. KR3021 TaxID=114890 RepID=A0AC35U305_9BILA
MKELDTEVINGTQISASSWENIDYPSLPISLPPTSTTRSSSANIKKQSLITVCVVGLSGPSYFKGAEGVGKSALCNRFCRQSQDEFSEDHNSILSQADFCGSPVINNDHWLWWGDVMLDPKIADQFNMKTTHIRVLEQTEFLSDETFNSITHKSTKEQIDLSDYMQRAVRTKLEGQGKLMYLSTDQLGQENDYPRVELSENKVTVDAFLVVTDSTHIKNRSPNFVTKFYTDLVKALYKTKKPVFWAASKCDIADPSYLETLQTQFCNKEWKLPALNLVETSALRNVNVKELFYYIAHQLEKNKTKFKLSSYSEAYTIQQKREEAVRRNFAALLKGSIPVKSYKQIDSLPWQNIFKTLIANPHGNLVDFLTFFGSKATIEFFKSYLNSLNEEWISSCLQSHLPSLKFVFVALLNRKSIPYMMWDDAKLTIIKHPLFSNYFNAAKAAEIDDNMNSDDSYKNTRVPIEILSTSEAQHTFLEYQKEIEQERKEEQREFEFIQFLKECLHITPGKSFKDAQLFLKGMLPFEQLLENKAAKIYDEYQFVLIQVAEKNFQELLLEKVDMFIKLLSSKENRKFKRNCKDILLTDGELTYLDSILQDDIRFRQLNILHELRLKMIERYAAFVANENSFSISCPCGSKCTDAVAMEMLDDHLQRVKKFNLNIPSTIEIVFNGEEYLAQDVMSTITESVARLGYNKNPNNLITFSYSLFSQTYKSRVCANSSKVTIYLVSCREVFENFMPAITSELIYARIPPLIIESPAVSNRRLNSNSDEYDLCSAIDNFAKQHNLNVISCSNETQIDNFLTDIVNRHLSGRQADIKLNLLVMCHEFNVINRILEPIYPYLHNNLSSLSSGCLSFDIPIGEINLESELSKLQSSSTTIRVDIKISSYHSWLNSPNLRLNYQGHIFTYQANRIASFEHMKVAIQQLITTECLTKHSKRMVGSCIMINALGDPQDFFENKDTNRMLTEGNQIASVTGALFQTTPQTCSKKSEMAKLVGYFKNVFEISQTQALASVSPINISDIDSNSSGFASTTMHSNGSRTSSASSNGNSTKHMISPKSCRSDSQRSYYTQTQMELVADKNGQISPASKRKVLIGVPCELSLSSYAKSPNGSIMAPLATPEDHMEIKDEFQEVNDLFNQMEFNRQPTDIKKPKPFPTELNSIASLENGTISKNNSTKKSKGSSSAQSEFEFQSLETYEYFTRNMYPYTNIKPRQKGRRYSIESESMIRNSKYDFLEDNMLDERSVAGGSDGVVSREATLLRKHRGIYRVPGGHDQAQKLEQTFLLEKKFCPDEFDPPVNTVATALKSFLGHLKDPIIPIDFHEQIIECVKGYSGVLTVEGKKDDLYTNFYAQLHGIFNQLPAINRHVLRYLIVHIQHIAAFSDSNSMTIGNMAKVWWPTLFRHPMVNFDQMNYMSPLFEKALYWIFLLGESLCHPTID